MFTETAFHQYADATLSSLLEGLEPAYERGTIDELELQGGILTIRAASGQTFVVSKHAPSGQIWLASPISGGLHFSYDAAKGGWHLASGEGLETYLMAELRQSGAL